MPSIRSQLVAMTLLVGAVGCASSSPVEPSRVSGSSSPSISSVAPSTGRVGTMITVTGSGFLPIGNTVLFGSGYIKNVASADQHTLTFAVPQALDVCPPRSSGVGMPCPDTNPATAPGKYGVAVTTPFGTSNESTFTLLEP